MFISAGHAHSINRSVARFKSFRLQPIWDDLDPKLAIGSENAEFDLDLMGRHIVIDGPAKARDAWILEAIPFHGPILSAVHGTQL